jgi:trigger factor
MKVNKVTDKEVDEVIEQYRVRGAKKFPVSGRPVQDQDFIKIDFTGSVNGEAIPGGDSKDFALQVGAHGSLPAFNEGVIGMQVGETKDIPIDYAADYGNKTLAGKTVTYHVTLKEIQAQELPALNDEFAQIANPQKKYETLDEMKRMIHQELADFERDHAKKAVRKALAEKIADLNPITIPEGLVQEQVRFMVKDARKKEGRQDDHVHDENCDHDHEPAILPEDEAKHRPSAIKILQEEILISQLAEDLNITVSEEDLNKEVASFMSLFGGAGNVEQIKKEWRKNGSLDRLRDRMQREKTLDNILDKIKLKEEMIDRA